MSRYGQGRAAVRATGKVLMWSVVGIAIMFALLHRKKTGEGQWVDLACIESAGTLHGAASLDASINGRLARREGMPNSNRSLSPAMAPHGVFACDGDNEWVSIAVRDDDDFLEPLDP